MSAAGRNGVSGVGASVLLRQSHGFEGVGSIRELFTSNHGTATEGPCLVEAEFGWDGALLPNSPVAYGHDEAVSRFDDLLRRDGETRPGVQPAVHEFPDAFRTDVER